MAQAGAEVEDPHVAGPRPAARSSSDGGRRDRSAACASRRAISASSLPSTYCGRTLIVAGRAYAARPRASRRRRLRLNVLLLRRSRSELWGAVARRRELLRPEVDEEEVERRLRATAPNLALMS